jgi:lipopolysaccharide export system protein LptC
MKTQALDIELENKVASSNKKVTVVQGNNSTRADGMVGRMEDEIIIMKPNVESIYAPMP